MKCSAMCAMTQLPFLRALWALERVEEKCGRECGVGVLVGGRGGGGFIFHFPVMIGACVWGCVRALTVSERASARWASAPTNDVVSLARHDVRVPLPKPVT
eukprot:4142638-Prymnesium_polylepis.1